MNGSEHPHLRPWTSGAGTSASDCPSNADLSLFIDGVAEPELHGRVVAHLEQCDDCREVVATVVQAQPHFAPTPQLVRPVADGLGGGIGSAGPHSRRLRWPLAVAAAAAVALAVRLVAPGGGQGDARQFEADVAALTQAVGAERTLEARVSHLTAHVPLASPTRSEARAPERFDLLAVATRLGESPAMSSSDPRVRFRARHLAAVAMLLAGRTDDAVGALETIATSTDDSHAQARVLADLSAAHAALRQWQAALDAARAALLRDPANAAGRFNEALALERLGRVSEAARAWLGIADDQSEAPAWRDEARRRLRSMAP